MAFTATYLLQVRFEATHDPHDDHHGYLTLFAVYNVLAGAGLVEEARWGALNLGFYLAAIGLHLLFNDRFMVHVSHGLHTWWWRTSLATAPLAGAVLTVAFQPPEGLLYAALTLVAGGRGRCRLPLGPSDGGRPRARPSLRSWENTIQTPRQCSAPFTAELNRRPEGTPCPWVMRPEFPVGDLEHRPSSQPDAPGVIQ